MFRNIFYNTKTNKIHLWETVKGEDFYLEIDWVPYVFVRSNKGNIKTIEGQTVQKKEFNNYKDYYNFCKDNYNIFENRVKPEIQFLAERYHGIPEEEFDVPKLTNYFFDIEVYNKKGFPDVNDPQDPIVLISIKDGFKKKVISFGLKEYKGKNSTFLYCKSERDLLLKFLKFMNRYPPDVISGWNIWKFDLPYIINRTKKLFGEDSGMHNNLSPIKIVRTWESKRFNELNIDIAGVCILDYMDLYKWYSPNKLESYSLDFVSKFELEKGKLDYSEYEDLKELYEKDWEKYVEYNIIDCQRVYELDEKLGYINLIQALSLLTKCPMKFYNAMTHLIEGAMLTYYRRNNLCAPFFAGGTQDHFPAAHVKEPQKGMKEWVIDIDITSSYPSHIITLNMSNETYVGRILGIKDEDMMYYSRNKNFPDFDMVKETGLVKFRDKKVENFNKAIKRGLISISPCGSVFSTGKHGVLADVERKIFFKRKEVKKKMKDMKNLDPNSERVKQLFSLQWSIKILLNAMFGILAVPYSRYFNTNIAEAITSCGRHTIKQGQEFVNEFLNNTNKHKELFDFIKKFGGSAKDTNIDYISYIDTDSLFISFHEFFKEQNMVNNFDSLNEDGKIQQILNLSRIVENYVNKQVFEQTQLIDYNSQEKDFKIEFKQEIIAKTALFIKKKKYAYWCINEEGTPVDKLSVTGLEIVRSDSSEAVRTRLKDIMEMIMKMEPDEKIIKKIDRYKKELKNVYPEEIAANIGINNINKYIVSGKPTKGTPWHVKGVAAYRMLLNYYGIKDKYEEIYESIKAKVVYVKKNPFGVETITFHRWPQEFDKDLQIDYDTMIDKFFLKKIGFLLDPMGKIDLITKRESEKSIGLFFKKEKKKEKKMYSTKEKITKFIDNILKNIIVTKSKGIEIFEEFMDLLDEYKEEQFDSGRDIGYKEALKENRNSDYGYTEDDLDVSWEEGKQEGLSEGYEKGWEEGYNEGYAAKIDVVREEGYDEGYTDGIEAAGKN